MCAHVLPLLLSLALGGADASPDDESDTPIATLWRDRAVQAIEYLQTVPPRKFQNPLLRLNTDLEMAFALHVTNPSLVHAVRNGHEEFQIRVDAGKKGRLIITFTYGGDVPGPLVSIEAVPVGWSVRLAMPAWILVSTDKDSTDPDSISIDPKVPFKAHLFTWQAVRDFLEKQNKRPQ